MSQTSEQHYLLFNWFFFEEVCGLCVVCVRLRRAGPRPRVNDMGVNGV